jgi:hypothetical protein
MVLKVDCRRDSQMAADPDVVSSTYHRRPAVVADRRPANVVDRAPPQSKSALQVEAGPPSGIELRDAEEAADGLGNIAAVSVIRVDPAGELAAKAEMRIDRAPQA